MKLNKSLILGILGGAMLALPIVTPAFAEPAYGPNSGYVERVDWWHHHDRDDYYRDRGWNNGYYYRGRGWGYGGYGACANAQRLQNQAWRDRRWGHPAAANDVAQQAAWARANCYRRGW
jgi:hypothetical protein